MVYEKFKLSANIKANYFLSITNVSEIMYINCNIIYNSLYTYAFPMSNIIMLSNIIMGLCVFKLLVSV